jgi:transcriptional regulator with XRE-family HTH domain
MAGKRGRPASMREGAKEAVAIVLAAKRRLGLSEADLAVGAGIDQSTVNRLLRATDPTLTPALLQVLDYVKNALQSETLIGPARRSRERELSRAVVELWDGTEADANRLHRLLRLVREFRGRPEGQAPPK